MSVQSMPFESINLAASALHIPAAGLTESSDDGLDPHDFLSQSQTHHDNIPQTQRSPTLDPSDRDDDETPTESRILPAIDASVEASFLHDSLDFSMAYASLSFEHDDKPPSQAPLEYLLQDRDSLINDLNAYILLHKTRLEEGEDCSEVRSATAKVFASLSENAMSLNEIYNKQMVHTDRAMAKFRTWDKKRTRVLRRIKKIKSDDNQFGAKLSALIAKRSNVDSEIESIQNRLLSLQNTKSALNKEIDETVSVLESKSAKYVDMFRNMERAGHDAVLNYLGSDNLPESGLGPLLKFEQVNVSFSAAHSKSSSAKESEVPISPQKRPTVSPTSSSSQLPHLMGIQPLVLPSTENIPAPFASSRPDTPQPGVDNPAYVKGFAKGSQQLESMKKKVASLVHNFFPPPSTVTAPTYKTLDDSSNTITQKLDVEPILNLLSWKTEVLASLALESAKMSERYHRDCLKWTDTTKFLNNQDDTLSQSLAQPAGMAFVENLLQTSLKYLTKEVEECKQNTSQNYPNNNYLQILTKQELHTIATALDQLHGNDEYKQMYPSADYSSLNSAVPYNRKTYVDTSSVSWQHFPSSDILNEIKEQNKAGLRETDKKISEKNTKNE